MINERLKKIRQNSNLTQKKFAEKLGIKHGAISSLELGNSNLTDSNIKLICVEFGVNEKWLRTGEGDMYGAVEDDIHYLLARYGDGLSDTMKAAIKTVLKMPPEKRKIFDEFFDDFMKERESMKSQDD